MSYVFREIYTGQCCCTVFTIFSLSFLYDHRVNGAFYFPLFELQGQIMIFPGRSQNFASGYNMVVNMGDLRIKLAFSVTLHVAEMARLTPVADSNGWWGGPPHWPHIFSVSLFSRIEFLLQ